MTINRPRDEVERLWRGSEHRPEGLDEGAVTFKDAPGDRGTEVHVELGRAAGGPVGGLVQKVKGVLPRARVMDHLRHFKQQLETGEVARSDGSPAGEQLRRKLKPRPAQPLEERELEEVGVR